MADEKKPFTPRTVQVRAKALGFYGASRREEGEIFPFTYKNEKTKLGKWMEEIPAKAAPLALPAKPGDGKPNDLV